MGPIEQEAKKGHRLLALGHDTYAEVSTFKGKTYGSIRRWFQADDGKWYRTKNGLNMVLSELREVLDNIGALADFFEEEGSHPYDNDAGREEAQGERGW